MKKSFLRSSTLLLCVLLVLASMPSQLVFAGTTAPSHGRVDILSSAGKPTQLPQHLLVKLREGGIRTFSGINPLSDVLPLSSSSHSVGHGFYSVTFPNSASLGMSTQLLASSPLVEYSEPVYLYYPSFVTYTSTPNDEDFNATGMVENLISPEVKDFPNTRNWYLKGELSPHNDQVWSELNDSTHPAQASAETFAIAVLDTGYYFGHGDTGNIVPGYDFLNSYSLFTDTYTRDDDVTPAEGSGWNIAAHGTCVAGEIAAASNNGYGNASVGFDNKVVIYKVGGPIDENVGLLPSGSVVITSQAVGDAIYRAVDDGCRVINMSLGGEYSKYVDDAIKYAQQHDVLVVAAAGNEGMPEVSYPAAADDVLAVGSYGFYSDRAFLPEEVDSISEKSLDASTGLMLSAFSNYPFVDDKKDFVLAPGEMIWAPYRPGTIDLNQTGYAKPGYDYWYGTSMASPVVAGTAAMLWRFSPHMSAATLMQVMEESSHDMGPTGFDGYTGYGRLDASAAHQKIISDYYDFAGNPETTDTVPAEINMEFLAPSNHLTLQVNEKLDSLYLQLNSSSPVKLTPEIVDNTYFDFQILPGTLADGTNTVKLTARDTEGHTKVIEKTFDFSLPTAVPANVATQPLTTLNPTGLSCEVDFADVSNANRYQVSVLNIPTQLFGDRSMMVEQSSIQLSLQDLDGLYALYQNIPIYVRAGNARGWSEEWTKLDYNIAPKFTPDVFVYPVRDYGNGDFEMLKNVSYRDDTYLGLETLISSSYDDDLGSSSYTFDTKLSVEQSYDNHSWKKIADVTTHNGYGTVPVQALRNTYYRTRSVDSVTQYPAVSKSVKMGVHPKLTKTIVKGTQRSGYLQFVQGYSAPRLYSGYNKVIFQAYRMRSGKWRFDHNIAAKVKSASGNRSSYSAWFRLGRGEWKIIPKYIGNSRYITTYGSTVYRSIQ